MSHTLGDKPSSDDCSTVKTDLEKKLVMVHLVHGTWPHGFWGRRSENIDSAWFEKDSFFLKQISELLGDVPFKIIPFTWSGRNSFLARHTAARQLSSHLNQFRKWYPLAGHMVVAHSHGGTVASIALRRPEAPIVDAFVAMATPFASLAVASGTRTFTLTICASLSIASIFTLLLFGRSWLFVPILALFFLTFYFIVPKLPYGESYADRESIIDSMLKKRGVKNQIPASTPVFVLRATQDEATLAIGLAQSVDSILQHMTRIIFRSEPKRLPRFIYLALIFLISALSPATVILFWVGLACSYVAATALLFFSVGHFNPIAWFHYIVEVDVAPPETVCQIKVYSSPGFMVYVYGRHGIYRSRYVHEDLACIISSISKGCTPSLNFTSISYWSEDSDIRST
jgi:hypothetical protein